MDKFLTNLVKNFMGKFLTNLVSKFNEHILTNVAAPSNTKDSIVPFASWGKTNEVGLARNESLCAD
jgi:hypothetical protein